MFFGPGILQTEEYKVRVYVRSVAVFSSALPSEFFIPALEKPNRCQCRNFSISCLLSKGRSVLKFSCWVQKDFCGLLAQSSFRLAKKLFLRRFFGKLSGYHVCSEETSLDSKNCLSRGWIPLLGTNQTQPAVYSSASITVYHEKQPLEELSSFASRLVKYCHSCEITCLVALWMISVR